MGKGKHSQQMRIKYSTQQHRFTPSSWFMGLMLWAQSCTLVLRMEQRSTMMSMRSSMRSSSSKGRVLG